tara:strand:- start:404 stop:559 length:156 start_codon:yes stop_codon:yes gene_type:complete
MILNKNFITTFLMSIIIFLDTVQAAEEEKDTMKSKELGKVGVVATEENHSY